MTRKRIAADLTATAVPEGSGSNQLKPKFALPNASLQYLTGERTFVHSSGDVFRRDDLKIVVAHDIAMELGGDVDDPRAHLDARGLIQVRDQVEAIVRAIFGASAFVKPVVRPDQESGEPEIVLEAHYSMGDKVGIEELTTKHDQFLTRYVSEVPVEAQSQVTLVRIAD